MASEARQSVHVLWLTGGGCDGCTMAVLGATSPRIEELLGGALTRSRLVLHHRAIDLAAGEGHLEPYRRAAAGTLSPFLLVLEGTLYDQRRADGGTFSGLGQAGGQPVAVESWLARLAPRAEAVLAIGTCATWGGVPAARGSVTGGMGLDAFLGEDFRSAAGLPVINVPGCAPSGDGFIEALQYTLLHLDGVVPLDLDAYRRPRWLYSTTETVAPAGGDRAGGGAGVTADCPIPARGWINRLGGCRVVGGACNGCTRPDFPDRTLPLLTAPPGGS